MRAILSHRGGRRALAELIRRGFSLADVAQLSGRSVSQVSRVLSGKSRSRAIEAMIAQLTGIPRHDLFPGTTRPDRAG